MDMERNNTRENVKSVSRNLEEEYSGVYLLYDGDVCVYVGESANVPYRLNQHIRQKEKVFDSYRVHYTADRKRMESFLIHLLHPKYNITGNNMGKTKGVSSVEGVIKDVIRMFELEGEPVRCEAWEVSRILQERTGYKVSGISLWHTDILKKYNALIEDEDGYYYDMRYVIKYANLIVGDIVKVDDLSRKPWSKRFMEQMREHSQEYVK